VAKKRKATETDEGGGVATIEAPPETTAEAVQTSAPMPAERYEPALAIELLAPSASNPRKTFKDEYLAQLAENLKARGQIHPILVRPVDVSGDVVNQYEIVVGECRYRAAKLAGLTTLAATVRDLSDVDVLKIQLDENAKRQDITPLEEAAAYQDLMKKAKWDAKQLAADQKVSVRQVYARLALLKLPKDVAKALSDGNITAEHAAVIASLKTPELQEDALENAFTEQYVNGAENLVAIVPIRDFKLYVKRDLLRDLNAAPWDKHDSELVKGAPACEGCPFRSSCNPDLFAEDDEDVCHDSECFNKKMEAHLRGRQTQLKSEGKEAVLVSHSWGGEVKGSVSKNKWEESKAKDAVVGILVDGPDRGKEIRVKVSKEKSGGGSGYQAPTKEQREAAAERERKANEKRKFDAKIACQVFMGLARSVPKELDLVTLRNLVRENHVNLRGDADKQDLETLKKITGIKGSSWHVGEKELATLTEAQCIASLYLSTFTRFLGEYSDNRAPLFAAAKKAGVDVDAVREKLKADEAGVTVNKQQKTKSVIRNTETGELAPLKSKIPAGWERGYVDQDGDYHAGDEPNDDKISGKQIKKNIAAAKKGKTPKAKAAGKKKAKKK